MTLPVLRIDTGGTAIGTSYVSGTIGIASADGSKQYLPGTAGTDNTGTVKLRGNSTATMPKMPYRINLNTSADLLQAMGVNCGYVTSSGKPTCDKSSNYDLLANYDDKTMLRDWAASALALSIPHGSPYLTMSSTAPSASGTSSPAWWAPHSLYVDLFINGAYQGVYQLIEDIGVDSHKVNVRKMNQTDMSGAKLTGGYLLEINQEHNDPYNFATPSGVQIGMDTPSFSPETQEQETYITNYVDAADTALNSSSYQDPTTGWRAYFDQTSLVDFYLVQDLMGNVDGSAFAGSDYVYKDENNPLLYMGPVWDFDLSSGNVYYSSLIDPINEGITTAYWYKQLMTDPGFKAAAAQEFNALKNNGILDAWKASIRVQAAALESPQANNFKRWPMLYETVWPNALVHGDYDAEVAELLAWIDARIGYEDSFLNSRSPSQITMLQPAGPITFGHPVTLTAQVTGSSPTGTVTFLENYNVVGSGTVGADGKASAVLTNLPVGDLTILAMYNGDAVNAVKQSGGAPLTVKPALRATTTALTADNLAPQANSTLMLTASVVTTTGTTAVTGSVTFSSASGVLGTVPLSANGTAVLSMTVPVGLSTLFAAYSGDLTYAASTSASAVTFTVLDGTLISLSPSSQTFPSGHPGSAIATVSGRYGTETPTGSVTLSVDGSPSSTVALVNGAAMFDLSSLAVGTHSLAASYPGDSLTSASSTTIPASVIVASRPAQPSIFLNKPLDSIGRTTTVYQGNSLVVTGWAASYANNGQVDSVQVFIDGMSIGYAILGVSRPDAASYLGSSVFATSGYTFTYSAMSLSTGSHQVTTVAKDWTGSTTSNTVTISVTSSPVPGALVAAIDQSFGVASGTATIPQSDTLQVTGWAGSYLDNGPATSVRVFVDGALLGNATLGISRPDIGAYYGAAWTNSGFSFSGGLSAIAVGPHSVTIVAKDSAGSAVTSAASTIMITAPVVPHPTVAINQAIDAFGRTTTVSQLDSLIVSGYAASYANNGQVDSVQVLVDGKSVGTATLGISRPDVAAYLGSSAFATAGFTFSYSATSLTVGTHNVTTLATDSTGTTTSSAATITVTSSAVPGAVVLAVDQAVGSLSGTTAIAQNDLLKVTGWAGAFLDNGPATLVKVYVDGTFFGAATLGGSRPDIASYYGTSWNNSGYSFSGSVSALAIGTHAVSVVAKDSAGSSATSSTLSIAVTAAATPAPKVTINQAIDSVGRTSTVSQHDSLLVTGWAASYANNGQVDSVQVLIDGSVVGTATLGVTRSDVATYLGSSAFGTAGFTFTYAASGLSVGTHRVTTIATDSAGPTTSSAATFTVTASTIPGALEVHIDLVGGLSSGDSSISQSDSLHVSGWAGAYVENGPASSVKVYVDGTLFGTATLGGARPDVAAVYGTSWTNVGYNMVASASSLSLGTHAVTVVAKDSAGSSATSSSSSITVTAQTTQHAAVSINTTIDSVGRTSTISQKDALIVTGWAASYVNNGLVDSVQVLIDGMIVGTATVGVSRPDVASYLGSSAFINAGFTFTYSAATLTAGTHIITAIAKDSTGSTTSSAATITVTAAAVSGAVLSHMDQAVNSTTGSTTIPQGDLLYVTGWAGAYLDNGAATTVNIYVDGVYFGSATLGGSRPDIAAAYGASWSNTGYFFTGSTGSLSAGSHSVTVVAADSAGTTATSSTRTITVTAN